MKTIKISLAIIVIAAITFAVVRGIVSPPPPPPPTSLPTNDFTAKIEQEIETLKEKPESGFCKAYYDGVKYDINTYFDDNRLGKDKADTLGNRLNKEYYENQLYSAYAEKFIAQAFFVFRSSRWELEDLKFIRSEYRALQSQGRLSGMLESNGTVDKKFKKIESIFAKYDEITGFISACNDFSYSGNDLSSSFPVSEVQSKLLQAQTYLNNNMENEYVKNDTRLKDKLKEIPQVLFDGHTRYLDRKIIHWSGFYENYNSQKDYKNNLYDPLKGEIDAMNEDTYKVSNFSNEYRRLLEKLNADANAAYNHFNK